MNQTYASACKWYLLKNSVKEAKVSGHHTTNLMPIIKGKISRVQVNGKEEYLYIGKFTLRSEGGQQLGSRNLVLPEPSLGCTKAHTTILGDILSPGYLLHIGITDCLVTECLSGW